MSGARVRVNLEDVSERENEARRLVSDPSTTGSSLALISQSLSASAEQASTQAGVDAVTETSSSIEALGTGSQQIGEIVNHSLEVQSASETVSTQTNDI